MRHVFRKYTSNRGSALFMVISTMTALLISVMAMYFAMVSSRQTQYAVFNKMQANQSAQSIADVVYNSIADPSNHAAGGGVLLQQMKKLGVGESISTGANGFASLDPSAATGLDESQLGAYSVTITRLPDKNGKPQYDVMVMSSVDGNRDAVHLSFEYVENTTYTPGEGEEGGGGDAELFAATGYVPNDAYIDGGFYLTNVFYDTQYTYMNVFGGSGKNRIGQDLSTGGDLMLGSGAMTVIHDGGDTAAINEVDKNKIGPVTWAIRGNFYPNLGNDFAMRGGSKILVGGDLTFDSGNNFFYIKNEGYTGTAGVTQPDGTKKLDDHVCVYINGDLNYSNSKLKPNTWLFVNGNVTGISADGYDSNSRLFVTGTETERKAKTNTLSSNCTVEEWKKNGDFDYGLTYDEAMELLGSKTQTIAYYKWDLSKNTEGSKHIDIRLNATSSSWTDDKGTTYEPYEGTYIISYDENTDSAKYIKSEGGNELGVIGKTFVIDSVRTHCDNNSQTNPGTIIIDTGNDPNNIMTLKLNDVTGNNSFSWFVDEQEVWWPEHKKYTGPVTGAPNNGIRLVLIRGRGTVLLDLPEGVTYQDGDFQYVGHVAWWMLQGGEIGEQELNGKKHLTFAGRKARDKVSNLIVPYIHKTCDDGDGCTFTKSESNSTCKECSGKLTQVTCSVHGDVNKYCKNCHPEKDTRTDWCTNHVDKVEFKKYYDNTLTGMNKQWLTDKNNEVIYPNTNIMIVSCDESAEMLFSKTKEGGDLTDNSFYGFIYAPYMSYLSAGANNGEGALKLCGGMTVGDYDLQSIDAYIGCYPDKMPNELSGMAGGGSMSGGKLGGTTKSWKIEIGGYT